MKLTEVYILKENYKNITNLLGFSNDVAKNFEKYGKQGFHVFKLLLNDMTKIYKDDLTANRQYNRKTFKKVVELAFRVYNDNKNLVTVGFQQLRDNLKQDYPFDDIDMSTEIITAFGVISDFFSKSDINTFKSDDIAGYLKRYPELANEIDNFDDYYKFLDYCKGKDGHNKDEYEEVLSLKNGFTWVKLKDNEECKFAHKNIMSHCGVFKGDAYSLMSKEGTFLIDVDAIVDENIVYINQMFRKANQPIKAEDTEYIKPLMDMFKKDGYKIYGETSKDERAFASLNLHKLSQQQIDDTFGRGSIIRK